MRVAVALRHRHRRIYPKRSIRDKRRRRRACRATNENDETRSVPRRHHGGPRCFRQGTERDRLIDRWIDMIGKGPLRRATGDYPFGMQYPRTLIRQGSETCKRRSHHPAQVEKAYHKITIWIIIKSFVDDERRVARHEDGRLVRITYSDRPFGIAVLCVSQAADRRQVPARRANQSRSSTERRWNPGQS